MALIICPECNSALSEHADKCPTCGCSRDTIQKLIEEKKEQFNVYIASHEKAILSRAEYEWDSYAAAISEAAEEYNTKFNEIGEKYKPQEEQLLEEIKKATTIADEANKTIQKLSAEKDKLGLFKTKDRKQYQNQINEEQTKCEKIKRDIHAAVEELETKRNAEIDIIAEKLMQEESKQVERIEGEVDDLTVRFCKSSKDVAKTMIKDKYYMAFHIRDMLNIQGLMTKKEIENNIAFADDDELGHTATSKLDEVLDDKEFCERCGITEKQVLDDYYYMAMSDSAKDKAKQEYRRAFASRMKELEDRRMELYRQHIATMSGKSFDNSKPADKPASVIKRGAAGAIIAGPAGAIIGVGSALNKNLTVNK